MLNIVVYNQQGEKVGTQKLKEAVFGIKAKPAVVHQAVVAQMANARKSIAHTKTRSEVRGGGRKPWRQKGTGRARHGSIRSPLWIGGGIIFGPRKERNYEVKINKKVRRKAIFMVLSDKVAHNQLILLDKLELPEAKTKKMAEIIKTLKKKVIAEIKIEESPKTKTKKSAEDKIKLLNLLIVLGEKDKDKDEMILRASRNLPKTNVIRYNSLNLVDLLKANYLICETKTTKAIENLFIKK